MSLVWWTGSLSAAVLAITIVLTTIRMGARKTEKRQRELTSLRSRLCKAIKVFTYATTVLCMAGVSIALCHEVPLAHALRVKLYWVCADSLALRATVLSLILFFKEDPRKVLRQLGVIHAVYVVLVGLSYAAPINS